MSLPTGLDEKKKICGKVSSVDSSVQFICMDRQLGHQRKIIVGGSFKTKKLENLKAFPKQVLIHQFILYN